MTSQLPATPDESFAAALTENYIPETSGGNFCRFTKHGEWLMGEEPVDGMAVLINSKNIQQGWIRWSKNVTERFGLITQPCPEAPPAVEEDGDLIEPSPAKKLTGTFMENGEPFEWGVNSKGGLAAIDTLVREIAARAKLSAFFYPKVNLEVSSYNHKTYGKIFTPQLDVIEWCDVNGNTESEQKQLGDDSEDTGERRRQRKRKTA